jgi:signal peptidase II
MQQQQEFSPGRILPLLASFLVIAGDRFSKLAVQRSMTLFDSFAVIPGWLRMVHYQNPGAAFGMLADGSPVLRKTVLIGVSLLVLLFVASALLGRSGTFSTGVPRLGLSLILGGALGNLYDRIASGTVTDFIEVYHGGWSFPAFNVADSAITVGAALLLFELLRPQRKQLDRQPDLASK